MSTWRSEMKTGRKQFRVVADSKELATLIQTRRGEYILGKTLLEEPLKQVSFSLTAYPDRVGFYMTLDLATSEVQKEDENLRGRLTEAIEKVLQARGSTRRVQGIICFSNSNTEQPKATIRWINSAATDSLREQMLFMLGDPFRAGSGKTARASSLRLFVNMGIDEEMPLQIIPVDNGFAEHCTEFFTLCEIVVNTLYVELGGSAIEEQSLFVRPARMNAQKGGEGPFSLFSFGDNDDLEKVISVEKPTVTFNDVGGQKEAKRLVEGLALALKHPELYQRWGTRPPKGILLNGPPGTGKTLLAKALANATSASFYHVKVTDILSMFHGKSEEHIDEVFDIAKENSPAIIFFDELDAIGQDRNSTGSDISRRLVTILLQNLDGLEELKQVIVIGATNRLNGIDPALRRAGRFDRIVPVEMPDDEGIEQILKIHIRKTEQLAKRHIFDLAGLGQIVPRLRGMSGADIAELARRTLEEKARMELEGLRPEFVSDQDLEREIVTYERIKKHEASIGFSAQSTRG